MIPGYLAQSLAAITRLANAPRIQATCSSMHALLRSSLAAGGKILLAGNGGSAADCQHIAGELVVRFRTTRRALPAIALTVDTSVLTACLNDFGPSPVFSRQIEALGRKGDVFWAFSTSGDSENILEACRAAKALDMKVLAFSGGNGGKLKELADICFLAPADVTSHIQECHIIIGHLLCHLVEQDITE